MKTKNILVIIIFVLIVVNIITIYFYNFSKSDTSEEIEIETIETDSIESTKCIISEIRPVLYVGIGNSVRINTNNVSKDSLKVIIENGSVKPLFSDIFDVYVNKTGITNILVYTEKENSEIDTIAIKEFLVKRLPNPIPYIGLVDSLNADAIISLGKVRSQIINLSMELPCDVISHTMIVNIDGKEVNATSDNQKLSNEQIRLIRQLKPGQHLIFKNIKAVLPDSTIRTLDPLVITIK